MESTAQEYSSVVGPSIEVDTGRIKPLLVVGGYLAFTLWLAWIVITNLPNVAPQLFPQRLAGLGYAQDIQGRVDGAVALVATGAVPASPPTWAFIGFSGGQEGIDIEQLAAEDDAETRYLGLCGASDATLTGLQDLSAPLFNSDLNVDCIVLAISPFHMVVRPFTPSLDRSAIKYVADTRLLKGRRQVLALCGVDSDPRYAGVDPWRPMMKQYFGVVPNSVMELRLEDYRSRGYFDIDAYDADGRQGECLREMVRLARERDSEVVILLMPTHPMLMDLLPGNATDKLRSIVAELDVPVLDYQRVIGVSGFHDGSHLDTDGRKEFTSILARDLPQIFDQ